MRYIIAAIVALLIIIATVILIFGRGGRDSAPGVPGAIQAANFAAQPSSSVSWTKEGELTGQDQRRSVRIKVTQFDRTAEIISGYEQSVIKSVRFDNNKEAYETFLKALDNLGFGRERKVNIKDEEGVCPLGNRFIYELKQGLEQRLRTWSTSCRRADGTFGGVAVTVRQLFENQITDYDDFIEDVEL